MKEKTLSDFNNSLMRQVKSYFQRQDNIDKEIALLEAKRSRLMYPHMMNIFKPIFEIIRQRLGATTFTQYGPFGLCCEKTIYWLKDYQKGITDEGNVLGSLCLISDTDGVMIRDTNKTVDNFKKGSIGAANGANYLSIEIDDTMDIEWLLEFVKRVEE